MKTNMVARVVRVNATGVHPGKAAGERELFTKEGISVLIHENGGVIQLPASMARGQLLLLANAESKCEVVAQVKRTYTTMNDCVELEFVEPFPRFWGIEFSAVTALLPKAARDAETAARIFSEASPDEPAEALPAPTVDEVEALKRQVRALRGEANAPEESPPMKHGPIPTQLTAAEQEQLPRPSLDFTVPLPRARGLFRAKGKLTPGAGLRLTVLTTALVVTAAAAAWYKHGIPWMAGARKASATVPAVGATVSTWPTATRETEHVETSNPNVASDAPAISPSAPMQVDESPNQPFASSGSTAHARVSKTTASTTLARKALVRPLEQTTSDPTVASPAESVVVPPKLIKAVRAVASLEDLRDFESGNVVIDAVVGTEGEVHFITVISGPPSLRAPAVEAVKQYRYEPATRNGQPVPEHVHIAIRFRFES
jgi:TonB-like protein